MSDEIRDLNERIEFLKEDAGFLGNAISSDREFIARLKRERDRFQSEWKASEEARGVLQAELAEYMKQVGNSKFMEGFDPIPCHGIDFWIKTKEKNGEIPEAAKNERS